MDVLLRAVTKLPMPRSLQLSWKRSLINRAYARDIAAARTLSDSKRLEELEANRRYELNLHDEDEDNYLTRQLLSKARRLRISIPHVYKEDNTVSEHWGEGHYSGHWCLTTAGIAALREEIRREIKARHELRAHLIAWLSALTGVIGAITGLVAVLIKNSP